MSLRIAVLVKQIPAFEEMMLGPDGRLVRDGLDLELSAYCRRAVAQAVALGADHAGTVTVFTLGPSAAEDCLREAIAWGTDRTVDTRGVLITDPAFAGSDTLATSRALAAALERAGTVDYVCDRLQELEGTRGRREVAGSPDVLPPDSGAPGS